MKSATQNTYESILDSYTPLDIKDIITNGAARKAYRHKSQDDILSWYAEYNEGLHHNLLDAVPSVCTHHLTSRTSSPMVQVARLYITGTKRTYLVGTQSSTRVYITTSRQ